MIAWSSNPEVAERQMQAIIFCLVAFGYIDSDFDRAEKQFIRDHIDELLVERAARLEESARASVIASWKKHYTEVLDEFDRDIMSHFTESYFEGESSQDFVIAKLKLGCFTLFKGFDEDGRADLLKTIDAMMHADGVIHPNEEAFRADVLKLLDADIALDDSEFIAIEAGTIEIEDACELEPRELDHHLLKPSEWDFASDAETFAAQAAGDMDLLSRVMKKLEEQREAGGGRLMDKHEVSGFTDGKPFLDGHVYVLPANPAKEVDLLVLGDLHGCYSCLKAALMQADFFKKVEDYKINPEKHPAPYLVLLGDYIDRGRFSYAGTMRAVMQLFINMPEHVFMLRGNHEYYVEIRGQVLAPVRPSEAMDSIKEKASMEVLAAYMNFFEAMPNMLIFDRTLFVHGGIPRDGTLRDKYVDLASLNNKDIRFEMLWSDPADADAIPDELQAENARFPFGRKQFHAFMSRCGLKTMVRGHERVREGFKKVYDGDEGTLFTLFSAGGKTNSDLPEKSSYRTVEPMALNMKYRDGLTTFSPFLIDYARYNDPKLNAFHR
jgi:uncharacterized tellurite resistance protein B-like protein